MRLSLAIPVAGLVLLSMSAAVADTGSPTQTEQLKFPYLLKIGAGNVLIVHGRQMSGSVTITWAAGDTVRINGVGVYPPPRVPPKQFSEQELADVYGKVPLVRDIVKTGATWHVAVAKYNERREDLGLRMNMLYWAVMDSTGSHGAAARAVLDSVDRSLLTPGSEPRVSRSSLIVDWDGMGEEYVDIGERATESKPRPWVLSDEDTQQYVQL
ncbi:MAG TPA: hypothetical protein VMU02_11055, partial [bacterium]|nr:hypothetical protein [bacterium]